MPFSATILNFHVFIKHFTAGSFKEMRTDKWNRCYCM